MRKLDEVSKPGCSVIAMQETISDVWMDFVQEAIALLQSTIPLKQDTYGDFSKQVADSWKLIGNSYLSIGDAEKALQIMKKVIDKHFTS
jgi:tetratricopeptide (TPR) repeat protein